MLLELTLLKDSFLECSLFCFDFNKTKEVGMIFFRSFNLPTNPQIYIMHLEGVI
ncbi:hypothetical protein J2743_002096 [Methanobacterium petrolearium]|nr:hypothetical protein [Methanobacterium petrolearium]